MAEFEMTIEDLERIIDSAYLESVKAGNVDNKWKYEDVKPAIMTALTMSEEQFVPEKEVADESIDLWLNRPKAPAEFLWGKKYIRIKDSMLKLVKVIICSGVIDVIIAAIVTGPTALSNIGSKLVKISLGVREIFKQASSLDDQDFCVYFKAISNQKKHAEFTFEDLKDWFQCGATTPCDVQQDKWDCTFFDGTLCKITEAELRASINSLCDKEVLSARQCKTGETKYKFKW